LAPVWIAPKTTMSTLRRNLCEHGAGKDRMEHPGIGICHLGRIGVNLIAAVTNLLDATLPIFTAILIAVPLFIVLRTRAAGRQGDQSPFPQSEAVLQSFAFPLADFVAVNPAFDPTGLTQVRFVFDCTEAGIVILDNVGFRK